MYIQANFNLHGRCLYAVTVRVKEGATTTEHALSFQCFEFKNPFLL